jgi:hypothetical protein
MKRILLLIGGCLLIACTKQQGTVDPTVVNGDTITYTKHILPLVLKNCALSGCHSAASRQSGVELPAMIKQLADGGRIRARVIHGTPSYMPATGKLSALEMNVIKAWLDKNAPMN